MEAEPQLAEDVLFPVRRVQPHLHGLGEVVLIDAGDQQLPDLHEQELVEVNGLRVVLLGLHHQDVAVVYVRERGAGHRLRYQHPLHPLVALVLDREDAPDVDLDPQGDRDPHGHLVEETVIHLQSINQSGTKAGFIEHDF